MRLDPSRREIGPRPVSAVGSSATPPLDLGWALRALHIPGAVSDDEAERLRSASYDDPAGFFAALVASAPLPLPRKSDPQDGIDLWNDLVAAWSDGAGERPVLRYYDALTGWQTLSYRELATQALALSQVFEERGSGPGDRLLLLLPMGPDFLIGFCAALRLGMQVAPLPPQAAGLLAIQIAVLQPHTIYTASRYRRLLPDPADPMVLLTPAALSARRSLARGLQSPALSDSGSHTYAVDEPLLQLCSPLAAGAPTTTVTASAGAVYGSALRDALLLGLYSPDRDARGSSSGVQLMAPAMHMTQHAPALLLAALAAGATLIEVALADAEREPLLWRRNRVSVHLVVLPTDLSGTELQSLLSLASSGGLPDLRRLFVCPYLTRVRLPERTLAAWLREGDLAAVVASQLHLDSASGGALLYSDPQRGGIAQALHLGWAIRHRLEDPGRPGQPSPQTSGRLRMVAAPPAADAELLLSRLPNGYFLGGTLTPRRRGRSFLAEPLLAFLRRRTVGYDYTLVKQAGQPDAEFHLLLFLGAEASQDITTAGAASPDLAALCAEIAVALGPLAVPDHIRVLPIHPRLRGGVLDHGFYQSSHDTGLLPRLCRDPALRAISTLRGLMRRLREFT